MDTPATNHPHLSSIATTLGRSMRRHVIENDEVRSAFAELAFELELARQIGDGASVPQLIKTPV